MTSPGLPPHHPIDRLQKRWQFLGVAQGIKAARGAVLIQAAPSPGRPGLKQPEKPQDDPPRIGVGFTATRKIGGAVVRNKAKRRLREAARLLLPLHGRPGWDYVFVARSGTPGRAWLRLLDDVKSALISLAADGQGSVSSPSEPQGSGPRPSPPPPHRDQTAPNAE